MISTCSTGACLEPEDKNLKFDDYTLDYMPRAIRKLKATFGVEEFSLLGWCIGAILTTIYAALRGDEEACVT